MGLTFRLGQLPTSLFTDASNNVGIGAAPSGSYKLEVTGTGRFTSSLNLEGYLTGQGTNPGGLGGSRYVLDWLSGSMRIFSYGADTSTKGGFLFASQSSNGSITAIPLTITSAGNVGINTTPVTSSGTTKTLQIGATSIIQSVVNAQTAWLDNAYYDGTSAWKYVTTNPAAGMRVGAAAAGEITFHCAVSGSAGAALSTWDTSDIKMRITTAGVVMVGNAVAATNVNLDINSVTNKAGRIRFLESGAAQWLMGNGAASENGRFEIYDNSGGTGVQLLRGATSWTALSDERFKDIIEPISVNDKLKDVRAVIGKYKTDNEDIRRNFLIAQDLLKVFPEVVDIDEDETKPMGVRYQDLIPVLVKAIQELQAQITELKNK